jgi:hypothetical protein
MHSVDRTPLGFGGMLGFAVKAKWRNQIDDGRLP